MGGQRVVVFLFQVKVCKVQEGADNRRIRKLFRIQVGLLIGKDFGLEQAFGIQFVKVFKRGDHLCIGSREIDFAVFIHRGKILTGERAERVEQFVEAAVCVVLAGRVEPRRGPLLPC